MAHIDTQPDGTLLLVDVWGMGDIQDVAQTEFGLDLSADQIEDIMNIIVHDDDHLNDGIGWACVKETINDYMSGEKTWRDTESD